MTYQGLSRLRAYRTGLAEDLATLRTFVGTEESHGISEAERQLLVLQTIVMSDLLDILNKRVELQNGSK